MFRHNTLAVTMDCQVADFWCWAAVAQSINAFEGRNTTQQDIASNHVSAICNPGADPDPVSACGSPCRNGKCNSPHRLSQVLSDEGHAVQATEIKTPLSFQDVVDVIDQGKPLPLRIQITTGGEGGHFICITGYADDGSGNEFVEVLDPLVPGLGRGPASRRDVPFETLSQGRYRVNGDDGIPNFKYMLR